MRPISPQVLLEIAIFLLCTKHFSNHLVSVGFTRVIYTCMFTCNTPVIRQVRVLISIYDWFDSPPDVFTQVPNPSHINYVY